MKYKPGQSGNPAGRPRGSKDRRNLFKELIEPYTDQLTNKAVEMALGGNEPMMKLLLDRVLPAKRRDEMLEKNFEISGSVSKQAKKIVDAMTSGEMDLRHGNQLLESIERSCRIAEMNELEKRVKELEDKVAAKQSELQRV